jgi:hypothetical protein
MHPSKGIDHREEQEIHRKREVIGVQRPASDMQCNDELLTRN